MKRKHRNTVLPGLMTALMMLSAAPAGADGVPGVDTRVRAILQGTSPAAVFGRAWHRADVYDASHFRDHFRMYVRVRRRSADPSLLPTAAASAEVVATLTRNGTPYAECVFSRVIDRDPDFIPDNRRFLDFGVGMENIGGDVKAGRGTCDTDLSNFGVQRGIPGVVAGDSVTVRLVGGPSAGQVLAEGSFGDGE